MMMTDNDLKSIVRMNPPYPRNLRAGRNVRYFSTFLISEHVSLSLTLMAM